MSSIKLEIFKNDIWHLVDCTDIPAINYAQNTVESISDRQQDYSQSFTLPITNRNAQVFEFINHGHHITEMPYKYFPCRIYEAGINIARSNYKLYIDSVSDVIEVRIVQNGQDLVEALRNLPLKGDENDYISPLLPIINWTYEDMIAANNNSGPHADLVRFLWFKPSQEGATQVEDVKEQSSTLPNDYAWSLSWCRPVINMRRLLTNALARLGYVLSISDLQSKPEYMDYYVSLPTLNRGPETAADIQNAVGGSSDHYDKLITTVSGSSTVNFAVNGTDFPVTSYTSSSSGLITAVQENFAIVYGSTNGTVFVTLTGHTYVAPMAGNYRIILNSRLANTGTTVPGGAVHILILRKRGNQFIVKNEGVISTEINTTQSKALYFYADEGDEIYVAQHGSKTYSDPVQTSSLHVFDFIIYLPKKVINADGNTTNADANVQCACPGVINLFYNSPYETAYDLFKDFIDLWSLNVSIETSSSGIRTVRLTTFDTIFNNNAVDWTGKISTANDEVSKSYAIDSWAQRNSISFEENRYVTDTDYLVADNANLPLEAEKINFPYLSPVRGRLVSQIYANFIMSGDFNIEDKELELATLVLPANVYQPELYDRSYNRVDANGSFLCYPITLSASPMFPLKSQYFRPFGGSITPSRPTFVGPYLGALPVTSSDIKRNLTPMFNGLIRNARVLNLRALLNTWDILTLDLLRPVRIDYFGGTFYINKISNRQGFNPCEVELIQISKE